MELTTSIRIAVHYKDGAIQTGTLEEFDPSREQFQFTADQPVLLEESVHNRRKSPRITFMNEVHVDSLGIRRTIDLSVHGMFVETLSPYPIGVVVAISFKLDRQPVHLSAKVVFTDPGLGMGVEFLGFDPKLRTHLDSFVKARLPFSDRSLRGDRRVRGDRRNTRGRSRADQLVERWEKRKHDRRKTVVSLKILPTELELSKIKSIFFTEEGGLDPLNLSDLSGSPVIVEFLDGEEVRGTLCNISPAQLGFFIVMQDLNKTRYRCYVIKSVVKAIHLDHKQSTIL